jgi:hypothetical protein
MCNCKENEFELLPELQALLSNSARGYHGEFETGRGKAGGGVASPSFVGNFSGPDAECTAALKRAGRTGAQALAIINTQVASAVRMLRAAAKALEQGKRSPETIKIFQRVFRVPPRFVPTWLKPTATIKDRGDVVAVRCRRVADLLASGKIRFFCSVATANCPDCGNDNSGFACSSWGNEGNAPRNSNVVCLGSAFWDAMKNGDHASVMYTVMHEPFHIYFGKYVTEHQNPGGTMWFPRHSVGKFGGIACIVQYVFEINGQTVPKLFSNLCSETPTRS